jgi:hypothetical protein
MVLEKQSRGICPITIDEVTYRLVAHTLVVQFKDIIMEHFCFH